MKKIVNVEAAIVCGDRWLMIERSAQEEHAGETVSFVGGKVDEQVDGNDVLETTLRRERTEEVGLTIDTTPRYVVSSHFITDAGDAVVNIVFLCVVATMNARICAPDEVKNLYWYTVEDAERDPRVMPWTAQYLSLANALYARR